MSSFQNFEVNHSQYFLIQPFWTYFPILFLISFKWTLNTNRLTLIWLLLTKHAELFPPLPFQFWVATSRVLALSRINLSLTPFCFVFQGPWAYLVIYGLKYRDFSSEVEIKFILVASSVYRPDKFQQLWNISLFWTTSNKVYKMQSEWYSDFFSSLPPALLIDLPLLQICPFHLEKSPPLRPFSDFLPPPFVKGCLHAMTPRAKEISQNEKNFQIFCPPPFPLSYCPLWWCWTKVYRYIVVFLKNNTWILPSWLIPHGNSNCP